MLPTPFSLFASFFATGSYFFKKHALLFLFIPLLFSTNFVPSASAAPARKVGKREKAAEKKERKFTDPAIRVLVQDFLVLPKLPTPAGGVPVRRRRRYRRYHRQTTPLYLKGSPNGKNLCRLTKGIRLRVLQKKGDYLRVRTLGKAQVVGYVPSHTVGLRVLEETDILGSPSTKDKIGTVRPGVLVRVNRTKGKFTQAVLMGPCPALVWFASDALGADDGASPNYSNHRHVGGSRMILTKGPIYNKKGGRKIGEVISQSSVQRSKVRDKWAKITLANYRYYRVTGWVPNTRLKYGYYGYWRGNGFSQASSTYSNGDMVSVMKLSLYLEKDDAYPTVVLEPGTMFRVTDKGEQWVSIHYSGHIQFTAYARRSPGAWVPTRSGLSHIRRHIR